MATEIRCRVYIECIWIEIFPQKAKSFLLSTLYRPAEGSKCLRPNFNEKLNKMLAKISLESKECMIMAISTLIILKRKPTMK